MTELWQSALLKLHHLKCYIWQLGSVAVGKVVLHNCLLRTLLFYSMLKSLLQNVNMTALEYIGKQLWQSNASCSSFWIDQCEMEKPGGCFVVQTNLLTLWDTVRCCIMKTKAIFIIQHSTNGFTNTTTPWISVWPSCGKGHLIKTWKNNQPAMSANGCQDQEINANVRVSGQGMRHVYRLQ